MDRLLKFLKALNPDNLPTKYGSYILWSDGFLRTFVKQKNNNVWILTVTFPDPEGSATSKFHTYCLAIGKSSQDHQPVIDHYLKEIETLASGLDLFCPQKGKYVRVQMFLLAYNADQPEKHSITNQMFGGIFGKRSLWASGIDHKHLPYCKACFNEIMRQLLSDKFAQANLKRCGRCCQWDMNSTSPASKKVRTAELRITAKYPIKSDPNAPLLAEESRVGGEIPETGKDEL